MRLLKHKISFKVDDIISHTQINMAEGKMLQRGMYYNVTPQYSVFLMSIRKNAPYQDEIDERTNSIIYEGHNVNGRYSKKPKEDDQPFKTPKGSLTENGKFYKEAQDYKTGLKKEPHIIKIYEKIKPGIWTYKGFFNLVDAKYIDVGYRKVFKFYLKPIELKTFKRVVEIPFDRIIPSHVKLEVWQRDKGKCVKCGATENLHYDHDLPYSKGGTSLTAKNIKLLCMKHNLQKSDKILSISFLVA